MTKKIPYAKTQWGPLTNVLATVYKQKRHAREVGYERRMMFIPTDPKNPPPLYKRSANYFPVYRTNASSLPTVADRLKKAGHILGKDGPRPRESYRAMVRNYKFKRGPFAYLKNQPQEKSDGTPE